MRLQIQVAEGDWGDTTTLRIQTLLNDVASHVTRELRRPLGETVLVFPTASPEDDPVTLYRSSPGEPCRVFLSARGDYWCQFAYQFAHEIGHVLSGHDRLKGNPNMWLHESICELASVFTLRRMAERWLACPPFPGSSDYSGSLARYVEGLLSREERRVPRGLTLASWLSKEESDLRRDPYIRDKNAVVAYSLLPIFEGEPAGWSTVPHLPDSSPGFKEYLREWRSRVDAADRPFLDSVLQLFEEWVFPRYER